MPIRHLLLDADGVVQRPGGDGWRALLRRHLGDRTDEFIAAVGEVEAPALRGRGGFPEGIEPILTTFGIRVDVEEFYSGVWLVIDPLAETLDLAASVRSSGLGVHLVTNQHRRRADWMKRELGYAELFDHCFYSCDLGVAKPDPALFARVGERLAADPEQLLLVDDSRANVEAARDAGLQAELWHHDDGIAVLQRRLAGHGVSGP